MNRVRAGIVVAALVMSIVTTERASATTGFEIDCSQPDGFVVDTPGRYRLTESVEDCSVTNAILVDASDVTIDLGGRSIDGAYAFSTGVRVVAGRENVSILNGSISEFNTGINFGDDAGKATDLFLQDCVQGVWAANGNTITESTIIGGTIGIEGFSNLTIANNTIVGQTGRGIDIRFDNVVKRNTIIGTGSDGLSVWSRNAVTANRIEGAEQDGVTAGAENRFVGNRIVRNAGYGVLANSDNVLKENVVRANHIGMELEESNRILENQVVDNRNHGIRVDEDNVLKGNRIVGNGANGVLVDSPSRSTILQGNIVKDNSAWGIYAANDPDIRKRRANKARGNGEPNQCSPTRICR